MNKMLIAVKAQKAITDVFGTSLRKQEIAKKKYLDVRNWWVDNVDEYKEDPSITSEDCFMMAKLLDLPQNLKFLKE